MYCTHCGSEISKDGEFCSSCGTSTREHHGKAANDQGKNYVQNTSGMGKSSIVPAEVKRWSWGAFGLNWIWGLGNETYIALLCFVPLVNLVMVFVLGARGNEWAWRNKKWASVADFQRVQRKWAIAWLIYISVLVLIVVIAIIVAVSSGQSKSAASVGDTTGVDAATTVPIDQIQITNLTLQKPAYTGLDYSLTAEVTNNSNSNVNNIELTVEAYDCPGSTITPECTHVGEAANTTLSISGNSFGEIPPNQTREVTDSLVDLSGMPPIQGNFLWSYRVNQVNQNAF